MSESLPQPSPEALEHSERLRSAITDEARAQQGIPFSRFMELAMYAPGLGYYSAGASKFGDEGDFVTAPELGPVFAACVAEAVAPVLQQLGTDAKFLEVGGGTGAFAKVALMRLLELDALPDRYFILEPSAQLKARQRALLFEALPSYLFDLVEWLDGPVPYDWRGVLFANEVIDALPVSRFEIGDEREVLEGYVVADSDAAATMQHEFRGADEFLARAVNHVQSTLHEPMPQGFRSELLPQLPYWIQAISGGMKQGAMLFVDYGYSRAEYYQHDRDQGTVRAFYRHRTHNDVLKWPGLQDLTASVDFTALAEAGVEAGFDMAGYCSQASFLLGNGLQGALERIERIDDPALQMRRRNEVKRLTLPSEMGERFQVMGFEKDVSFGAAFLVGDLSYRL